MAAIRALIFDFNGVLVDDEYLHCSSAQEALRELGLTLSRTDYYWRYLAYDDRQLFTRFLQDQNREVGEETIRNLVAQKSSYYFQAIEAEVPVIEPTLRFIRSLPVDLPLAIASAAARKEIQVILERLQLRARFCCVVAAEDVSESKPHPEAFQTAYGQLKERHPQLRKAEVAVVEDSDRGVRAALRAGLRCVAVTTSYSAERLQQADLVTESLEGWSLSAIEEAISG